jgi:ABC-type branched-subunit amino acid transport system substrate-binding protein
VHGRHLQLLAQDDGYEVDKAVANAKRLIEKEKVFALMAFYGTASTTAVLPVLDASDVPLIGTISGAESLRNPVNPHVFHLRASYGDETSTIVANLLTVGLKRIAVLYQDDGFGQAGLAGVKAALSQHQLAPVAMAAVPRNSAEVGAAVEAIAKASPQAVVLVTLAQASAEFIKRSVPTGERRFFAALSPVGAEQLVAALGQDLARGVLVAQVIPSPVGERLGVVREYRQALATFAKKSTPSHYGMEGYLNAKLVAAALERAGPKAGRERLVAALRAGPFDLGGYKVGFHPGSNSGSSYVEVSVVGADGRVLN